MKGAIVVYYSYDILEILQIERGLGWGALPGAGISTTICKKTDKEFHHFERAGGSSLQGLKTKELKKPRGLGFNLCREYNYNPPNTSSPRYCVEGYRAGPLLTKLYLQLPEL